MHAEQLSRSSTDKRCMCNPIQSNPIQTHPGDSQRPLAQLAAVQRQSGLGRGVAPEEDQRKALEGRMRVKI
jgi:hypothetical protein